MGNTLAVVCCYGLFDPKIRSPKEIEGYRHYLIGVARHVIAHPAISKILICGGKTNPRRNISEAETVEPILVNMFSTLGKKEMPEIVLGETMNSAQHVSAASELLQEGDFSDCVIFCDKKSSMKVWALGDHLFSESDSWRVVSFKRKDIHPKNRYLFQWFEALRCLFQRGYVEKLLEG